MAIQKNNGLAYDLSLFEPDASASEAGQKNTAKKKAENKVIDLGIPQAKRAEKRKLNPVTIISVTLLVLVVAAVLSLIVYNNVMLNEYNEQILQADSELVNQENLRSQYQLKIDRTLTKETVQDYAEGKLGMQPANSVQKEFISLTDGDKGEVLRGDEKESFLSRLTKLFSRG